MWNTTFFMPIHRTVYDEPNRTKITAFWCVHLFRYYIDLPCLGTVARDRVSIFTKHDEVTDQKECLLTFTWLYSIHTLQSACLHACMRAIEVIVKEKQRWENEFRKKKNTRCYCVFHWKNLSKHVLKSAMSKIRICTHEHHFETFFRFSATWIRLWKSLAYVYTMESETVFI